MSAIYSVVDVEELSIFSMDSKGAITDFDNTVAEVVKGSTLPLSIIIIGVGDENILISFMYLKVFSYFTINFN